MSSYSANSFIVVRLALALTVLWGHAWYLAGNAAHEPLSRWLLAGTQPIAVFAMQALLALSGYLVVQSAQRAANARQFLWRRLVRIFPALWACLAFTAVVVPLLVWNAQSVSEGEWSDAFRYFWRNLVFMRTQTGIAGIGPVAASAGDLNGSLWMLEYQVGCYVVLAALVWLGFVPRSRMAFGVGLALLLLYFHDCARPASAIFFNTDGRRLVAWFIAGGLASQAPEKTLRSALSPAVTVITLVIYAGAAHISALAFVGPLLSTVLVLGAGWNLPGTGFDHRVGGDYSYGIYLYGYPVQQTLSALGLLTQGFPIYLGLTTIVTLSLAVISQRWIETPAGTLRQLPWLNDAPLRHPANA